jgi:FkbM family methyltransferase
MPLAAITKEHAPAQADAAPLMMQFRCPNGLLVWHTRGSDNDTSFVYRETFEEHCYERHGVTLRDGAVILDVGAHVGMFALSLMGRFRGLKMVCVEPVPVTRDCLVRNVTESPLRGDHEVTVVASAIGSSNGSATISYFPHMSSNSTLYLGDKHEEWRTIVGTITVRQLWKRDKWKAFLLLLSHLWRKQAFDRFVEPVLAEAVSIPCQVGTLSETIREQRLQRIDLLKIDVEGAELDVLKGLEDQLWPRVQQLAVEISPAHKHRLAALVCQLRAQGFTKVTVESMLGGTAVDDDPMPCTLYAVRAAQSQ